MVEPITVLLADDHPVLRRGLRHLIEEDGTFRVVSEVDDGLAALSQIEELRPKVAVLDADMPRLDGLSTLKQISLRGLSVQVLILTMHSGEDLVAAAMELNAKGFVLKHCAVAEIVVALRAVADGQSFWSAELIPRLLNRNLQNRRTSQPSPLHALTPSERRIFQMVADGKSSKQIADELFIAYRTVENHRTQICSKLSLAGPNSLIRFAAQYKP